MEPPILGRIRQFNDELLKELQALESMPCDPFNESAFLRVVSQLRSRLTAHVSVDGRLILGTLRERGLASPGLIARLSGEHRSLLCRVVKLESGARSPAQLPRLARAIRDHLELESHLLPPVGEALSRVPAWRADELYERAGGATEYWVEHWLG